MAGWLAPVWHVAELTTHFKVFYFLTAIGSAALFALRRRWVWLAFAVALISLHMPGVASWYLPASRLFTEPYATLRVVTANVLTSNREHERFLDFIRETDPDVIFLQEVDAAWGTSLEAIEEAYPYHVLETRSDNFGIALFSRLPLEEVEVRRDSEANVPAVHARLTIGDQTIRILSFHALPPGTRKWTALRNLQLDWLAEYVAEDDGPVIIAGDLNVTPWSPNYKNFMRVSGLKNTRKGHGIVPTWPQFPFPLLPLDHILISPDIHTQALRRGPDLGSDHRPLIADLVLPL